MTNLLAGLFNVLIKEGYTFVSIKEGNHYRLASQRTSCSVMITDDEIEISLCLLEDVANKSYASERHVMIESIEDFPAAEELILCFEDWCNAEEYWEEYYSEE